MTTPRIYGYARTSTRKQDLSLENQETIIRERAAKLEADSEGIWVSCAQEQKSAVHIPWNKRPAFKLLYDQLHEDDVLIVHTLSRIDRSPWRMFACLEHLMDRGVRVIALELDFGGKSAKWELDLSTPQGKFFVTIIGAVNMWWLNGMMEASAAACQLLSDQGFICGSPRMGKRAIKVPIPGGKKTHGGKDYRVREEWEPEDCAVMREIWIRRHVFRESIEAIGRDLLRRGTRVKQHGKLWCWARFPKPLPRRTDPPRVETRRLRKALTLMNKMVKTGNMPPELEITEAAIRQVAEDIVQRARTNGQPYKE